MILKNGVKQQHEEIGTKEILTRMMAWLWHYLKKALDLYSKTLLYCTI